jgi:ABC-type transport system substrate-binding protein
VLDQVDAQKLVATYVRYYPLFQKSFQDLGYPNGYFNDRLVQVIDHLLAAPDVPAPVALTQPKVLYQYADPALGVARTYVSSNIRKGVMFSNTAQYKNPAVDEAFDKAAVAPSREERQKSYSEAQRLVVEDVPVVWLLEMEFPTFVNKKFKDVVTTGIGVNESFDAVYMVK